MLEAFALQTLFILKKINIKHTNAPCAKLNSALYLRCIMSLRQSYDCKNLYEHLEHFINLSGKIKSDLLNILVSRAVKNTFAVVLRYAISSSKIFAALCQDDNKVKN